ncbi:hypothetical protein BGZ96_003855, partial [Linnemannia gamsii]
QCFQHTICPSTLFHYHPLGDSGAGKTVLLIQFVKKDFDSSILTTVGFDHAERAVLVRGKDR